MQRDIEKESNISVITLESEIMYSISRSTIKCLNIRIDLTLGYFYPLHLFKPIIDEFDRMNNKYTYM